MNKTQAANAAAIRARVEDLKRPQPEGARMSAEYKAGALASCLLIGGRQSGVIGRDKQGREFRAASGIDTITREELNANNPPQTIEINRKISKFCSDNIKWPDYKQDQYQKGRNAAFKEVIDKGAELLKGG